MEDATTGSGARRVSARISRSYACLVAVLASVVVAANVNVTMSAPAATETADSGVRSALKMIVASPRETGGSGLTCERDGFFIQGFETSKVVDSLGSQVPVSRALCTSPALSVQQTTVFARSVNCGSSRLQSRGSSLVCPPQQFLFGFEDWKANFVQNRLLPLGPVRCCTLQLQELDAIYDVEPCKCITAAVSGAMSRATGGGLSSSTSSSRNAVTCPGKDQLIVGFPLSRYGFENRPLPTSPTKCCEACVTKKRMRDDRRCMIEFNNCSGNGRCAYGACVCFEGFSGDDCSYRTAGHGGSASERWWSDVSPIVLVILVTGAGLSLGVVIANLIAIVTWYRQHGDEDDMGNDAAARARIAAARQSGNAESMRQRLLNDVEDASSSDTSDDELDSDIDDDDDDHDDVDVDDDDKVDDERNADSDGAEVPMLDSGDEASDDIESNRASTAAAARDKKKGKSRLKAKFAKQRAKREARIEHMQMLHGDSFPHDFLCPITQELMVDPVIAADGHSYERKAIKRWFKHSLRSPKTGALLSHPGVTRNFTLRAAINTLVRDISGQNEREDEFAADADAATAADAGLEVCSVELCEKRSREDPEDNL